MTILNVVLTIWLCKKIGAIGAAIGTAVSTVLLDVIVMNFFYHRYLYIDIPTFWKTILRMSFGLIPPILFGLAVNRVIYCNTLLKFSISVIFYTTVYCVSMWFISTNREEKELIGNIFHIPPYK
jgi:O-antigen/teichoic acid export membrane protein